jgi:hypothetical protein
VSHVLKFADRHPRIKFAVFAGAALVNIALLAYVMT